MALWTFHVFNEKLNDFLTSDEKLYYGDAEHAIGNLQD
jgi:hypothetical protein